MGKPYRICDIYDLWGQVINRFRLRRCRIPDGGWPRRMCDVRVVRVGLGPGEAGIAKRPKKWFVAKALRLAVLE
jgi:hypothetical protein